MQTIARKSVDALQSLFIYGAAGLVAMGQYVNLEIGAAISFYPLLWLTGGLFVYNLDRLVPDAADPINLPGRCRFRRLRTWIVWLSLGTLLAIPICKRDWPLLVLLCPAILISSLYTLVVPGFSRRIKDVSFLKWLVPPIVIMGTLTAPAWITPDRWEFLRLNWRLLGGIFCALLLNILLFDERDIIGDTWAGVKTLANKFSHQQFSCLLWAVWAVQIVFAIFDQRQEMVVLGLYSAGLVALSRRNQHPNFYHWLVDGILFIPLVSRWLFHLRR